MRARAVPLEGMGKNPFEQMDPDMQAMRASMRPTAGPVRWGRVATGVLVVACITFALAYYVPLRQAHQTLMQHFSALQTQAATASHDLEQARSQAKALGDEKQKLQSQLDEIAASEKARTEASRAISSGLEQKLKTAIAKNQVAVRFEAGRVVTSLALGYVLSPGKLDVSGAGKVALCTVASAADKRPLRVVAVADQKSIPALLAKKLKTPLEYTSAASESVAQTLLEKCKVDPSRLSAAGTAAEPAADSKLEGKKLEGARVELWLDAAP